MGDGGDAYVTNHRPPFDWWSGEELGLPGSLRYVGALSQKQKEAILVYANVDVIASPNGFAGVYDEPTAAAGSSNASRLLRAAVTRNGATPSPVDLHNGSDHYGFVEAGVATTGVFSGSLDPVSVERPLPPGRTPVGPPTTATTSRATISRTSIWASPESSRPVSLTSPSRWPTTRSSSPTDAIQV